MTSFIPMMKQQELMLKAMTTLTSYRHRDSHRFVAGSLSSFEIHEWPIDSHSLVS